MNAELRTTTLITPDVLGRLVFLMAQEAGHIATNYSVGSFSNMDGYRTQVRLVLIDGTYLIDFSQEDRLKTIDELRAALIERRPHLFKPQVDEKAELKKRIRDALDGAITHLDGLRAELQILKEAHE